MLIVGLTGGIASGKSTAGSFFESLGIVVIDADTIAKQLVQSGQVALRQITERFGKSILNSAGELDRVALRTLVFNDKSARLDLEAILHPLIRTEMQRRISAVTGPYCILAIPLLIETGQSELVDRILVIDSDESLQYQRLRQRGNLDDKTITAIISAQATRAQRLLVADDIVTNNGTVAELEAQLQDCHRHYLELSRK